MGTLMAAYTLSNAQLSLRPLVWKLRWQELIRCVLRNRDVPRWRRWHNEACHKERSYCRQEARDI